MVIIGRPNKPPPPPQNPVNAIDNSNFKNYDNQSDYMCIANSNQKRLIQRVSTSYCENEAKRGNYSAYEIFNYYGKDNNNTNMYDCNLITNIDDSNNNTYVFSQKNNNPNNSLGCFKSTTKKNSYIADTDKKLFTIGNTDCKADSYIDIGKVSVDDCLSYCKNDKNCKGVDMLGDISKQNTITNCRVFYGKNFNTKGNDYNRTCYSRTLTKDGNLTNTSASFSKTTDKSQNSMCRSKSNTTWSALSHQGYKTFSECLTACQTDNTSCTGFDIARNDNNGKYDCWLFNTDKNNIQGVDGDRYFSNGCFKRN